MQATMMNVPLSLTHFLDRAAALFPTSEVVSQMPDKSRRRHGYREIRTRARALAQGLLRAGLKPGDRVATFSWNHHAHLEAYFGVPMAGGVYHTLNLRLAPSEIAFIANHAGDRFLIVDDVLLPLAAKFIPECKFEAIFVVSLTGKPTPYPDYETLLTGASDGDAWQPPPVDENQAAGMCYTSGTTGAPKGVVYSHRAIVLHSLSSGLIDTLGIRQSDAVAPVVPMFHANAWGIPFTATMVGAKQVYPGPHLDPESLLDLYAAERVTCTGGVPTIWLGILQALDKAPSRWKLTPGMRMVVGGSAAPESLIRALDKHGLRVIHAWGMTETAPLGTVANVKSSLAEKSEDERYAIRTSQGLPVPLVEIRARTEAGLVPWDGHSMGELQVRGPWVAASYYAAEAPNWTDDGWFKTGDVVTIDPEGYVRITDRTKDLIKSGGEWISSVELENALMGHPAVKEAAVVAIPHVKWAERPLAVVVFKEGHSATPAELRAHLEARFPKWWMPEGFVVRSEIPRTSTGKFLKSKLRDELASWQAE